MNYEDELRQLRAAAAESAAKLSARHRVAQEAAKQAAPLPLPPPPPPKRQRTGELPPALPPAALEGHAAQVLVVEVPDDLVGLLIGKNGAGIRHLEADSKATVTVGKLSNDGFRKVCLSGTAEAVAAGKEAIEQFIVQQREKEQAAADFQTVTLEVPERFARQLIGKNGERIRCVREVTGARITMEKDQPDLSMRCFTIKGTASAVQLAQEQVEQILLECFRRSGIFNAQLEQKYAADRSSAEGGGVLMPADPALALLFASGPGLEVAKRLAAVQPEAVLQQVLAWADHYAGDPAAVAYYEWLSAAGA